MCARLAQAIGYVAEILVVVPCGRCDEEQRPDESPEPAHGQSVVRLGELPNIRLDHIDAATAHEASESGQYQLYRGDLLQERFSKESLDVVLSRFNVATTLKGAIKRKMIELVHVFPKDRLVILSGIRFTRFATTRRIPAFVVVEIDGDAIAASKPTGFRTIKPEYLLFLKIRDDGRYELVSGDEKGQASVRTLNLESY